MFHLEFILSKEKDKPSTLSRWQTRFLNIIYSLLPIINKYCILPCVFVFILSYPFHFRVQNAF